VEDLILGRRKCPHTPSGADLRCSIPTACYPYYLRFPYGRQSPLTMKPAVPLDKPIPKQSRVDDLFTSHHNVQQRSAEPSKRGRPLGSKTLKAGDCGEPGERRASSRIVCEQPTVIKSPANRGNPCPVPRSGANHATAVGEVHKRAAQQRHQGASETGNGRMCRGCPNSRTSSTVGCT
jgi:hypothetical protein